MSKIEADLAKHSPSNLTEALGQISNLTYVVQQLVDAHNEKRSRPKGEEKELVAKLDMPIEELNLSIKTFNYLSDKKVMTVRELVTLTAADLILIKGFGRTCLREVTRKLEAIDLRIGMLA